MSDNKADETASLFKKKGRRQKKNRTTGGLVVANEANEAMSNSTAIVASTTDSTPSVVSPSLSIEEMKMLQKERKLAKARGIDVSKGDVLLQDGDKPAEEKRHKIMGSEFQEDAGNDHEELLNEKMNAYVEAKIAQSRLGDNVIVQEDGPARPPEASEKEKDNALFQTPAHLKIQENTKVTFGAGEGWLTGLSEVELPVEDMLNNVKRTEEAKRAFLAKRAEMNTRDSGKGQANFRFDKGGQVTNWDQMRNPGVKQKKPSDHAAVARFLKNNNKRRKRG